VPDGALNGLIANMQALIAAVEKGDIMNPGETRCILSSMRSRRWAAPGAEGVQVMLDANPEQTLWRRQ
jgi:hypothetical protein